MKVLKNYIGILAELSKAKITMAVAITTMTGFVLQAHEFSIRLILPTLGIFLLACGSSVINQIQEYQYDAKMERTMGRPIPEGKISIGGATLFALTLIISGSVILFKVTHWEGLALGLLALIWYNVIYTPMKRWTYYAVIPGSVIGYIPPLVGWVSAGGSAFDTKALFMALFFFIWQVPHFWLLMLKYGHQYKQAGFPTITDKSEETVLKMTYWGIWATAISAIILSYFQLVNSRPAHIGILISSIWLIWVFTKMIRKSASEIQPMKYFMKINYYVVAITAIMLTDHLFL